MSEPIKKETSSYSSPLRAEQKERTHERILEAAAEQLLEEGLEEPSLPRAARRARVSVPTVYRHFPTQEALMRELTEWVGRLINIDEVPESVDEFTEWVPRLFANWDENEALIRARLLSAAHRQIHRDAGHRKDEAIEKAMEDVTARLDPLDARRACAVVRLLVSGAAWEMMRDNWDLTGKQAGEALAWATSVLVAELRSDPNSMERFTNRAGEEATG
ncbi:MAG: TetR/AcrR family transcriptional regulator [Actinomycetota bacterium]|nr:TetR/AcrR family transcriptional regulator [Actinomycetota bacterium]